MKVLVLAGLGLVLHSGPATPSFSQDSEKKLSKRIAAIDTGFLKALESLAKKYDEEADPEAAHFFAECALGFGSKDEKVDEIRRMTEYSVYYGKVRGGKVLEKTSSIKKKLAWRARLYNKAIDDLKDVEYVGGGLSKKGKEIFRKCVLKVEIAKWATEYVQTIQEVNRLRRKMGLRAILWDFEHSKKLILACAWWSETLMSGHKCDRKFGGHREDSKEDADRARQSIFYSLKDDEFAGKVVHGPGWLGFHRGRTYIDSLRPRPLLRMALLNPNARRLWLGHFNRRKEGGQDVAYSIPQRPYRKDIPTPRERYGGKTVAKNWVDTEETVRINGKKIPYVRYPYDDEPDAPPLSRHQYEGGWDKGEPPDKDVRAHGMPITVRFFGKLNLTEAQAELRDEAGKIVELHLYTNEDNSRISLGAWPTILLLPDGYKRKEGLKKGEKYTVTIKCKLDRVPFEKTWSFTTRRK